MADKERKRWFGKKKAKKPKQGVDAIGVSQQQVETNAALKVASGDTGGGGPGGFEKALVAEVITDPETLVEMLEEEEGPFVGKIKNEEVAKSAPRGSLLVKKVAEKGSDQYDVAIPMLSSHVIVPAKVGEQVWIYDDGSAYLYWLGRVGASGLVEDVNFTHKDREFETPVEPAKDAKSKADSQNGKKENFIARYNDGVAGSLGGTKNSPKDADAKSLRGNAKLPSHGKDNVPRFTPRPGDVAFQGSNNTLISLGTDRGWKKGDEEFPNSNAENEILPDTGTIDIVAGRGNPQELPAPTTKSAKGDEPTRTGMRLIEDEDGNTETDKVAKVNENSVNRAEGDPDFYYDSSRMYVSMNSAIDDNFSLADEAIPLLEGDLEDKEAACIALKTNEIRLVAREDGSIRIYKEKGEGGNTAQIILASDGTIHIQGEKIFIGKEGGGGEGPSGTEPYVKHSELKDWALKVHGALNGFCQTMAGHAIPWFGQSPQITAAATSLQSELNIYKKVIDKWPSDKIYGE